MKYNSLYFLILDIFSSNHGLLIMNANRLRCTCFRLNMDQHCVNLTTAQKPNVAHGQRFEVKYE